METGEDFAVTGNSGAGKSSLISALRGIHHSDQNAAMEGVTLTTREMASYTFPNNDQITLYDLPGVGTWSHPIKSYMPDMNFKQFNYVLIVSSERFSENDTLIIKELRRLKMPFYLVRSKMLMLKAKSFRKHEMMFSKSFVKTVSQIYRN
jgi:GTP-binding protein EngB required for normal cell division